MPYKFKSTSRGRESAPTIFRPSPAELDEGLTGFVRGYNASDIEERFARALIAIDVGFWFQYKIDTITSLPDQEKRVDFVVFWMPGKVVPVDIYGDRWHSTAGDRSRDRAREIEINNAGRVWDWEPLEIVWGHDLQTQQMADQIVRRMFI